MCYYYSFIAIKNIFQLKTGLTDWNNCLFISGSDIYHKSASKNEGSFSYFRLVTTWKPTCDCIFNKSILIIC